MQELIKDIEETAESPNTYNCQLKHPKHGWIPHTAAPLDSELDCSLCYSLIVELINSGKVTPKPYDWAAHWESAFNSKKSELKDAASLSNQSYDALTDEQKTELQDYYAALDALVFSGDAEFAAWPAKPEFL